MMITEFVHEMFGTVRTVEIDGEPWFVAHDVCRVLGHTETDKIVKTRLDDDEYQTVTLETDISATNRTPNSRRVTVSESGLYSLILWSQKDEAKPFRRWITHEIIPSIRRTNTYNLQENDAPAWARDLMSKVDAIAEDAAHHQAHMDTSYGYSLADTARRLGMAPQQLNRSLVQVGALRYTKHNRLVPADRWVQSGYLIRRGPTTVVTPEGLDSLSGALLVQE